MWTAIRREHFACLDRIVPQIFILLISNGEKILSNVNVVGRGQVKSENSSLQVCPRLKNLDYFYHWRSTGNLAQTGSLFAD